MEFKYKQDVLENGLRVVYVPMKVPTITCMAMVGVGSRYEDVSQGGISHFVEHMVFKGTSKYPSAQKVAQAVDGVGASYNAFTSKEFTGFYIKSASEHVNLSLDILSQFLWKPLLGLKDLERERGVILEEINMYEDTPMRNVGNIFESLMYRKSSLGRDVIGSKKSVKSVKRDDFSDYMSRWYRPLNIVLGIAGDSGLVGNGKMKINDIVNKYFAREQKGDWIKTQNDESGVKNNSGVKVVYKKTEQAHFVLGVNALKRGHKDRYVQLVLATILGGNMSSRMFEQVREKRGLAYYVRTGVGVYNEVGHVSTQAGVTINKVEEAIEAVRREYEKVCRKGEVSEAELKKAKQYLVGQIKIGLEDSQEVVGGFVDSWLLENKIRTPEEVIGGVEAVLQADILRLANELFGSRNYNLAVIGPFKGDDNFKSLVKK